MVFSNGHALIIGVGTYRYAPYMNVPTITSDAQDIAAVLRAPQFCGYPADQVTLVTDDYAVRHGMLDALDRLATTVTASDTVFILYWGHGALDAQGQYYLTSYDTTFSGYRVMPDSAVSCVELLTRLRRIKAKRLLLMFNSAFQGELSPTLGESWDPPNHTLPADVAAALIGSGEGRVIITSCREGQYSYIGDGYHTIFGQALIDGLRGEVLVRSNERYIDLFELYDYLYEAVNQEVQRLPYVVYHRGGTQEPELTVLQGLDTFPIALYKGSLLPAPIESGVNQINEKTRPVQVDSKTAQRMFGELLAGSTPVGGRSSSIFDDVGQRGINTNIGDVVYGGTITSSDLVDGDKVAGDKVGGDKISVGTISGSSGIAIGRGARASVIRYGADAFPDLGSYFQPILAQIAADTSLVPAIRSMVTTQVELVLVEASKGEQANANIVADALVVIRALAPDTSYAIAETLRNAPVSGAVHQAVARVL